MKEQQKNNFFISKNYTDASSYWDRFFEHTHNWKNTFFFAPKIKLGNDCNKIQKIFRLKKKKPTTETIFEHNHIYN